MPVGPLCRFRDALGEPGRGVHAPRLFGLAAVDLLATAALAWLIAWPSGRGSTFLLVFLLLMIAAVAVHGAFCVNTRLNAALLGRGWPLRGAPPAKKGARSALDR